MLYCDWRFTNGKISELLSSFSAVHLFLECVSGFIGTHSLNDERRVSKFLWEEEGAL